MGTVVTVNKKCDRCGALYGEEQTTIEELLRRTTLSHTGDGAADVTIVADEPIFRAAMVGDDGEVIGHEYRAVCKRCRSVLTRLLGDAGPVQRTHRSQAKDNGKPKAKKEPKGKEE